jgi:hypothetical protein
MTVEATVESAPPRRRNPYIGPRAFRSDESLPNRQREARDLADLIIAERIVLLHAPSGAGKTSLIQAAVLKMLREDGFYPVGPVRVDRPGPAGREIHNRYIYSVALYLLEDRAADPHEVDHLSLKQVLEQAKPTLSDGEVPVLVIDQLEEILTLDPTDWREKEKFFQELGAVLADGFWWALLAMREDYIGGLDRYLRFLPGYLRSRYRLDFLSHSEALAAIQKPAKEQHVNFDDDAAKALVGKLATIEVEQPGHASGWLPAPYVEPAVLQVVCRKLWKDVRATRGDNFPAIESGDIGNVDIIGAISKYYEDTVADVAKKLKVSQRTLRDWFETALITPQGIRTQTTTGPISGEKTADVLRLLEDGYLIRADTRSGTTWYELAHDRLIRAIRDNNYAWRVGNLAEWQVTAWEWRQNGQPKEFLLQSSALARASASARAPTSKSDNLTDYDRDFVRASQAQSRLTGCLGLFAILTPLLIIIIVVEAVIIILFAMHVF